MNVYKIYDDTWSTISGPEQLRGFTIDQMKDMLSMNSDEEVVENGYNLSVSTYVEAEDTREKIDIVKLNAEIKEIVAHEQVLRDEIDKIIADIEGGQNA